MLKIYLARHGQDEDNVRGILNGHRDQPLTALGQEQAQKLADFIVEQGITFDYVYCSPLQRARQTALAVTNKLGLPEPSIYPELIERDFGSMTGQLIPDIEKLCAPSILKTATVTYFLEVPGAELFPDLLLRAKKFLAAIKEKHESGSILLVSHGDFGKMIYAAHYGLKWENVLTDFHFGNTELILLDNGLPNEAFMFKAKQFNK